MLSEEIIFIFIENTNLIAMTKILVKKGSDYPEYVESEGVMLKLVKITDKGSAIYKIIEF